MKNAPQASLMMAALLVFGCATNPSTPQSVAGTPAAQSESSVPWDARINLAPPRLSLGAAGQSEVGPGVDPAQAKRLAGTYDVGPFELELLTDGRYRLHFDAATCEDGHWVVVGHDVAISGNPALWQQRFKIHEGSLGVITLVEEREEPWPYDTELRGEFGDSWRDAVIPFPTPESTSPRPRFDLSELRQKD